MMLAYHLAHGQQLFLYVLSVKRATANIVSKLLRFKQKIVALMLQQTLTTFNNDPNLLKKLITSNESWVYGYDIETKMQSFQWKRSRRA